MVALDVSTGVGAAGEDKPRGGEGQKKNGANVHGRTALHADDYYAQIFPWAVVGWVSFATVNFISCLRCIFTHNFETDFGISSTQTSLIPTVDKVAALAATVVGPGLLEALGAH